jgi:multisubunit Na+/H+ antiporter MnhF subunit
MLEISAFILVIMFISALVLVYRQQDIFSKLLIVNLAGNIGLAIIISQFIITESSFYLDIALIYALCTPIVTIVISRLTKWL